MQTKKSNILLSILIVVSLFFQGVVQVHAQSQTDPTSTPTSPPTTQIAPTTVPTVAPSLAPLPTATAKVSPTIPAPYQPAGNTKHGILTNAERNAAALRAAKVRSDAKAALLAKGNLSAAYLPIPVMNPGGVPDYFGTTPNYANSPIQASIGISGDGTDANALAVLQGGQISFVNVINGGSGYTDAATEVTVIGGGGTGAILKAVINPVSGAITAINVVIAGSGYNSVPGIRKFVDSLPGLNAAGINDIGQYIPIAVPDKTTYPGSDYYELAVIQYTQKLHKDLPATTLRGYVQISTSIVPGKHLQLFYPGGTTPILDNLGAPVYAVDNPQYLGPIIISGSYNPLKTAGVAGNGQPTRIKFSNYLPLGTGGNLFIPTDPTIMGAGMGPTNEVTGIKILSGGSGYTTATVAITGDGAGATATAETLGGVLNSVRITNPGTGYTTASATISGNGTNATVGVSVADGMGQNYTQNRANIHLHGGNTPWISDGTPHQWTTPAGENTVYPEGVSVYNVPDMVDPGPGSLTFFYTNEQSARLMFYHDHSYGLTRLNVYAGAAAGYIISDPAEQTLVTGGTIPGTSITVPAGTIPATQIPLIIQDKGFVPSESQLAQQDPTWNSGSTPGTVHTGDLWFPHVYMPNQNPFDSMGANAMGRWDYGPWFWPPFTNLTHGMVPNPLYPSTTNPLEGPNNPGIPNPSLVPESFVDTMLVNGTVYPYLDVTRQAYRFRILNASNDRFINLQLYCAKSNGTMWDLTSNTLLNADAGEVKMVPAVATKGFPATWPTDGRDGGVPDPAQAGPSMIQIGTEGGFLPGPVKLPNQPVNYLYDRRNIVVLNVTDKTLFLGPAERADVIIDFSQVPASCSNLILYNDSPAPVPAFDPRNDYYTGDPDLTSIGGAPTTLPGYGPNTRTIMQIRVSGNAAPAYNEAALATALPAAFAVSQPAPIVPQAAYNAAYGASFPVDPYARIQDTSLTFTPFGSTSINAIKILAGGTGYTSAPIVDLIGGTGSGATATATITGNTVTGITITNGGSGYTSTGLPIVIFTGGGSTTVATATASIAITLSLQPKAIQELFTLDYGRMDATLGVEIPNTTGINQTTIPLGYIDPTTEIVQNTDPMTPLGTLSDGTQIWKITHNGVDTHAIHWHMFNVQLINRVGWDGMIRPTDPNELGWKETIRMNPLEDAIVALRPIIPVLPFKIGNSLRALDVTLPLGAIIASPVDPLNNPVSILNAIINYGWEYVWHCHLLGHEENDMMRPMIIAVAPAIPTTLVASADVTGIKLTWDDSSMNATKFIVERATDPTFKLNLQTFAPVDKVAGVAQSYIDTTAVTSTLYYYRVSAAVDVGGIGGPATNFPSNTATSKPSNTIKFPINLFSLTVFSSHGAVVKAPNQPSYTTGTTVNLTIPVVDVGWKFSKWTGNACATASSSCSVTIVADVILTANYVPGIPTISGNAGVGGATLTYTGGVATADVNGNYAFTLPSNPWTGTVTPTKPGYTFLPTSRTYTGITLLQSGQNYTATAVTYSITGTILGNLAPSPWVTGVTLTYTDGTLKTINTNAFGVYTIMVPSGWSGTVTPSRTGILFTPANRAYTNVVANQITQNFVRQQPYFKDVPFTYSETFGGIKYSLFPYIQAFYNAGFTTGCATIPTPLYCPADSLTRAEASVFILKAINGVGFMPPVPPGYPFVFLTDNWNLGLWAHPWAEEMYHAKLTSGCSTNPLKFCPWDLLPRDQASVYALKIKYGTSYVPPKATGKVFADMTNPALWSTAWAEKAYQDGLMVACGTQSGKPLFCPSTHLDRAWTAYMIVKAGNIAPVPYP